MRDSFVLDERAVSRSGSTVTIDVTVARYSVTPPSLSRIFPPTESVRRPTSGSSSCRGAERAVARAAVERVREARDDVGRRRIGSVRQRERERAAGVTVAGATNVAVGATFVIVTCAVSVADAVPSETRTPTVRLRGAEPSINAAENVTF